MTLPAPGSLLAGLGLLSLLALLAPPAGPRLARLGAGPGPAAARRLQERELLPGPPSTAPAADAADAPAADAPAAEAPAAAAAAAAEEPAPNATGEAQLAEGAHASEEVAKGEAQGVTADDKGKSVTIDDIQQGCAFYCIFHMTGWGAKCDWSDCGGCDRCRAEEEAALAGGEAETHPAPGDGHASESAEEGHAGGGRGGGHGEVDRTSAAVIGVFFGCLVMGGAVNSILHWNDADIRMAAHRMLSVSVSIFCAMTLFKLIEGFVFKQIIASPWPRGLGIKHLTHQEHLGIELVMFPCFLAAITWCCRRTCQEELGIWFNVAKLLVPHIAGFCGFMLSEQFFEVTIDEFRGLYSYDYICVASIIGLVFFIRLLCWAMHFWRKRPKFGEIVVGADISEGEESPTTQAESKRKQHEEAMKECTEAIEEGEDEVTAFVLSGALYGFIRYLVLSRPGVSNGPECAEHIATFSMIPHKLPGGEDGCVPKAVVSGFIHYSWPALAALFVTACPCWGNQRLFNQRVVRCLSMSSGLLTCRLVLGMVVHWFFWCTDSEVTVYMGAALFTTTLAVVLTFVFDFLADTIESLSNTAGESASESLSSLSLPGPNRNTAGESASDAEAKQPLSSTGAAKRPKYRRKGTAFVGEHLATSTRALMSVFGLLVGLSWEMVFEKGEHVVVEFVNSEMRERDWWQNKHTVLLEMALTTAILACVVPVWAKHLVPAAEKDRAYHEACIEREAASKSSDMFTPSVLRRLCFSCCPCCIRFSCCSCCKGTTTTTTAPRQGSR